MAYISDGELEDRVRALRREIGLEDRLLIDPMTVIQKLKQRYRFNYLRVPDTELPDHEAQWDSSTGTMRIREKIFCGMQSGVPRARMTFAHEVGHFALKHEGIRNRGIVQTTAEKFLARVKKEEDEATRFAPRFLAPQYLIARSDSAEEISIKFGLSREASIIRRNELDVFYERRSRSGRALPDAVLEFLREAEKRGYQPKTNLDP